MNKYELTVVVNAKIEDDARVATVEKVKEYVARYGGTITNVDEWGKKRLAYEIQKMKEGFYYFIQFEADATAPAEIERHVRIMENVIRYLCVRQEAQKTEAENLQIVQLVRSMRLTPQELTAMLAGGGIPGIAPMPADYEEQEETENEE